MVREICVFRLLSYLFVLKTVVPEEPDSQVYFDILLMSRSVYNCMQQLKYFLNSRKTPLKLHLTTKALTLAPQRLVFASSIVGPSGFICNMYSDCLQPGNSSGSEGG